MKILETIALLLLISTSAFAQEAHSPKYKCELVDGDATPKYLLIGNKFPQIPDLDFSNEVVLVEAHEYFTSSYPEFMKFTLTKKDGASFETDINIIDDENGLTQTKMKFENNILTFSIQHPLSTCDFEQECLEEVIYNCISQGYVESAE